MQPEKCVPSRQLRSLPLHTAASGLPASGGAGVHDARVSAAGAAVEGRRAGRVEGAPGGDREGESWPGEAHSLDANALPG